MVSVIITEMFHGKDDQWQDKFTPGAFVAASELGGWMQPGINLCPIGRIRANLTYLKNFDCSVSRSSLPPFPSITNLILSTTVATEKLVKKVIIALDFAKMSGPDGTPVVVLKNPEPDLL